MSSVNFRKVLLPVLRSSVPGQLVVQITDRCNARCPQCGMRVTERFPRSSLSVEDVKKIVDRAASRGVRAISFTGGEPLLLFDELVEMIETAAAAGIDYIRTGTNGYLFRNSDSAGFEAKINRIAERLARTALRNFWISIDSAVPAVHEKMRGFPGVINGIAKALPIFHAHGIYPSANLGINRCLGGAPIGIAHEPAPTTGEVERAQRSFKQAFRRFYRLVADLGFTIVNACYPMSIDTVHSAEGLQVVYGANSQEQIVKFSRLEKALLFKALLETIPEFRQQIRIFSPLSSLYALYRQYGGKPAQPVYPCRGGIDFFFIDARDAHTYPCGYRGGENLGKYWEMNGNAATGADACTRCDWECFRDPSELFGPLLAAFSHPAKLLRHCVQDWSRYRIWLSDVRYYKACDYFDGRRPPNTQKLTAFDPGWNHRGQASLKATGSLKALLQGGAAREPDRI